MNPYMRVLWERFKIMPFFYLWPYLMFIVFLTGTFLIFSVPAITRISLSTIVAIVLFLQALFIFIQLFIVNQQKNYAKIAYLPRMVVNVNDMGSSMFSISIRNLGEVAYNLSHRIIIKESASSRKTSKNRKANKRKRVYTGRIYFIEKNKEHFLKYFEEEEFITNEIIIDAHFEDIFHFPHQIRFIKLSNERGFRMITSGI